MLSQVILGGAAVSKTFVREHDHFTVPVDHCRRDYIRLSAIQDRYLEL
jgi:hypothetical protein